MTMMTMKQCGEVRKRRAVAAKTWVSTTKQCQGSWLGREVGEGKRCWHMEQSTVACSRSSTTILLTKIIFLIAFTNHPMLVRKKWKYKVMSISKKGLVPILFVTYLGETVQNCRLQMIIPKLIFKLLDIAV